MSIFNILEIEGYVLDNGMLLKDTGCGAEVIKLARTYLNLRDKKLEGPRVPINEFISRIEDMSPNGQLRLFRQEDGDICVAIIDKEGIMCSVEFCVSGYGGGKSPNVLQALSDLGLAMLKDNND